MPERFELRQEMARDEVSIVHRAFDRQLQREVALKRLLPGAGAAAGLARRLVREARAIAQVRSPHVLSIHEVGEDDQGPFLSMELTRGETLRERLERHGELAIEEVVRIGTELCMALSAIHRARLVHGNVTLDQIFLDAEGSVRLTGFALARTSSGSSSCITTIGQTTNSSLGGRAARPSYAPDAEVDAPSDIFALGTVLFECLAGERAAEGFVDGFADATRLRKLRPDLPRGLEDSLQEALQRVPLLRFESAADFAQSLGSAMRSDSGTGRAGKGSRRIARPLAIAGVLALGLVAAFAWTQRSDSSESTRGLAIAAAPVSRTHAEGYRRSHALLVGIDRYRDASWGRLSTAEDGARALRDFLVEEETFAREDVRLLLGDEATYQGIRSALYDLAEVAPDDRVLFYFAGHGVRQETPHGGASHQGYLVPWDGTSEWETVVQHGDLESVMDACPAKHFLTLLDCCYSGLAVLRSGSASPHFSAATTETAREVLAAGRPGEQVADAFEDSGHSAFTCFLLRGLRGEALPPGRDFITAGELGTYLLGQVIDATGGRQNPTTTRDGLGSFVFRSRAR